MSHTPVAISEHRGDATTIRATIQRFIAWRKAAGLTRRPARPSTSSIPTAHHSAGRNPPDLCVGTDRPIEPNGERIEAGSIPGGRCAVLRVVGDTDDLEPPALYFYRDWQPASGEEARDFPLYCQRLAFFPEVPEHEAVAELFLPLK